MQFYNRQLLNWDLEICWSVPVHCSNINKDKMTPNKNGENVVLLWRILLLHQKFLLVHITGAFIVHTARCCIEATEATEATIHTKISSLHARVRQWGYFYLGKSNRKAVTSFGMILGNLGNTQKLNVLCFLTQNRLPNIFSFSA
jgi:hypothetical protein